MPVHSYKTKKGTKYRYIFGYHGKSYEKWGFNTSKEAKQAEAEQRQKLEAQLTSDILFNDLIADYLNDIQHRVEESTMQTKRNIIDKQIIGYMANKPISDISALDVRKWQDRLLKSEYSDTFKKTTQAQLSAIFNFAVKFYGLSKNPVQSAGSIGKSKREKFDFWTYEEFKKVIDVIDDYDSFIQIYTLFFTGMRIGECVALTWQDIDFKNNIISVSKTKNYVNGRWVVKKPKTAKSKREITIPPHLTKMLNEWRDSTLSDTVFNIQNRTLAMQLDRYAKEANVHRIRVHDLRHSHASLLINRGCDIAEVAQRLGHDNIQTTINTYIHLYPDRQAKIASDLENLGISWENKNKKA